jgi:enoyl-[acyl-carrier protein] reductase/trans-2-enoyl-CoA reductase (NAD+)
MAEDVQAEVKKLWPTITTENLDQTIDFEGYQHDFLNLFGFGLEGVDYAADADSLVWVGSIAKRPKLNYRASQSKH